VIEHLLNNGCWCIAVDCVSGIKAFPGGNQQTAKDSVRGCLLTAAKSVARKNHISSKISCHLLLKDQPSGIIEATLHP